jgi:hypothetical protein
MSVSLLNAAFNKKQVPFYETIASRGVGVLVPFNDLIDSVTKKLTHREL